MYNFIAFLALVLLAALVPRWATSAALPPSVPATAGSLASPLPTSPASSRRADVRGGMFYNLRRRVRYGLGRWVMLGGA